MDFSPAPLHVFGELREVIIQVLHHFAFERVPALPQALEARNSAEHLLPVVEEAQGRGAQRFLKVRVL